MQLPALKEYLPLLAFDSGNLDSAQVESKWRACAQGTRWRATPNARGGKDQTITISKKDEERTNPGVAHFYAGKVAQFLSVANSPRFMVTQNPDDLFLAESAALHSSVSFA